MRAPGSGCRAFDGLGSYNIEKPLRCCWAMASALTSAAQLPSKQWWIARPRKGFRVEGRGFRVGDWGLGVGGWGLGVEGFGFRV